MQLHGGTGYMHGTEVERHYRDARILGIGGGATEVLTDLSARLLGYTHMNPLSTLVRPLGGEVSVYVDTTPEKVWDLVSDVTRIGEFSPETFEARWTAWLRPGRAVGAKFKGHVKRNGVGPTYWSAVHGHQVRPQRGLRVLGRHRRRDRQQLGLPDGARTVPAPRSPSTSGWSRRCRMRFYWLLLGHLRGRTNEHGMRTTLERMKAVLES